MNKKIIFILCLSASLFNLQSAENINGYSNTESEEELLALTKQAEQFLALSIKAEQRLKSIQDGSPDGQPTIFDTIQGLMESTTIGSSAVRKEHKAEIKKHLKGSGCFTCGATNEVKFCGRCKAIMFCSKKCQKITWENGHKEECSKIALMMKEYNF